MLTKPPRAPQEVLQLEFLAGQHHSLVAIPAHWGTGRRSLAHAWQISAALFQLSQLWTLFFPRAVEFSFLFKAAFLKVLAVETIPL